MPSNSAVQPAMHSVRVWRGTGEGAFRRYEVPASQNQTILDLVTYIQRVLDPSLAYRFACRVGMCGSCAMTVNGRPRWTCRTHVAKVAAEGEIVIAPLREHAGGQGPRRRHARVLRQMGAGERRLRAVRRRRRGFRRRRAGLAGAPGGGRRHRVHRLRRLLRGLRRGRLEPGLSRAGGAEPRLDARQRSCAIDGQPERLLAVAGDAGCHACHSHESCRTYCPKSLNPTASIAGLKRAVARAALRGEL